MVELRERSAFAGLDLPLQAAEVRLAEAVLPPLWSVSFWPGEEVPQRFVLGRCGAGTIWAGADLWFVTAPPDFGDRAAVTEQGDGWVALDLTGPGWQAVFARLCPLDPETLDEGACARSALGHMMALIIGLCDGVRIMAMRSFARSLHHELEAALRSHAARTREG